MTDIKCRSCGHVRETTEDNPTLATCENCGAWDLTYTNATGELHG